MKLLPSASVCLALAALLVCPSAASAQAKKAAYNVQKFTQMPHAIASFGAATDGTWLYIYGGNSGRAHSYSKAGVPARFYRLSLADKQSWEELPGGRSMQSVALVHYQGDIIRIGGLQVLNEEGQDPILRSSSEVKLYKPLSRRWKDLPALPAARSSHDAFVLGDHVYVFGGWTIAEKARTWLDHGLSLSLKNPKEGWQKIAQPFRRRALAVMTHDSQIYVLGGITDKGKLTPKVASYNPKTKSWTEHAPLPGTAFGTAAFVRDRTLYASDWKGHVYEYDVVNKTWTSVRTLTYPRFFHRFVVISKNVVAVISGAGDGGKRRNIEWLDFRHKGRPLLTPVTIPAPGRAKARQIMFQRGSELFVFGGNTSTEQHAFEPENFLKEGFRIDLARLRCHSTRSYPKARQSAKTVVISSKDHTMGYALGGFGHDGTGQGGTGQGGTGKASKKARSQHGIYEYNFLSKRWSKSPFKLPKPLTQFGVTAHGREIWVFGGLDYNPDKKQAFDHSLKIYMWNTADAKAGFWEAPFQMPRKRRAYGYVQDQGKFYMVGGLTDNFQLVKELDVFDFKTKSFSTLPAPTVGRISPQCAMLNGRLYLAGGSSKTGKRFGPNQSLEEYDPSTKKWRVLIDKLPVPARELRMMTVGPRLLLYSALSRKSQLKFVFIDPRP